MRDLDVFTLTVCKMASFGSLADVKRRYCITLTHVNDAKSEQHRVFPSTKAGHELTSWSSIAQDGKRSRLAVPDRQE